MSQDAIKTIKKNSQELAMKIEQLQKTNARISKLEDERAILEKGRLPNGNKPFAVPFETPLWDSLTVEDSVREWSVTVPEGTSPREARDKFYLSFCRR